MMDTIVLNRYYYDDTSIFGYISILHERYYTLESLRYRIPCGRFKMVKEYSPKFHRSLWSVVINGRVGIRIHPANFSYELRGCIACGIPNSSIRPTMLFESRRCTSELESMLDIVKPSFIIIKDI